MSYCIIKSTTLNPILIGVASNNEKIHIIPMIIFDACFDDLALKGFKIALCLSIAIAVNVKMDTFTLNVWINGQNGHINFGRSHR